jgi:hypothetical protein
MLNRIPFGLITLELVWVACLALATMTLIRAVDVHKLCSHATLACSAFGAG